MSKVILVTDVMAGLRQHEYIVYDKKAELVLVYSMRDEGEHVKRMYKMVDVNLGVVDPIDLNGVIREIIEKVEDKVEVKKLLEETLKTSPPSDILEALRRLKQPKKLAETKTKPGCYSLNIPGNRGQRPLEIAIRR